ncbi:MAG: GspH/FimT family pseudopilin [Pseudomonadota bacterium]
MSNSDPLFDAGPTAPCSAARDAGFSLIELMVVTTIIATLSVSAVLSLRMSPGATPVARMEEFARAVRYLQSEALFADRTFALSFAETGWEVLTYQEPSQGWVRKAEGTIYARAAWSSDIRAQLEIEGRDAALRTAFDEAPEPDVILLASGETTPFVLRLGDDRGRGARCDVSEFGELSCVHGE